MSRNERSNESSEDGLRLRRGRSNLNISDKVNDETRRVYLVAQESILSLKLMEVKVGVPEPDCNLFRLMKSQHEKKRGAWQRLRDLRAVTNISFVKVSRLSGFYTSNDS